MNGRSLFLVISLLLLALGSACGGKKPSMPEVELPDSKWPELSYLLTESTPIQLATPEETLLVLFQKSQAASSRLLSSPVPGSCKSAEMDQLMQELTQLQEQMNDISNLTPERVLRYQELAQAMAKACGMSPPTP